VTDRQLPATAWAVLGVLSWDREMTGYDVKQWADHSLTFFYWSPAVSQIYGELKRLEAVGYITGRDEPVDEQRTKRVYAITDDGRKALTEWLEESSVDAPVLKHGVMLRVWLGHMSTPERLRATLLQHREQTEAMLADVTASERSAEHEPDWSYPALVLRWGERYYRNELAQIDELLQELDGR